MLFIPLFCELSRSFLAVPDGEKLNWLSMPIALLNSQNNRRAFSRGRIRSIGFAHCDKKHLRNVLALFKQDILRVFAGVN
jgi:hypothetical protein